jgi:non-specific protein-tyrosine kinase
LSDAFQRVHLVAEPGGGGGESSTELYVLPSGATPPNPIQMLSSHAMREVVKSLRDRFDHVVVDTAPLLRVGDTEALLEVVDGVLVVARVGQTTTDDLRRLAAILEAEAPRALGVVVNDVGRRDTREGYYAPRQQPATTEERLPL